MDDLSELGGASRPESDIVLAEEALKARDTGDAEMYFERYLRKNPAGKKRWEVWNSLLDISLHVRQDKTTAREYLEIMLLEYGGDASRRRDIQQKLASLCNEMRLYSRATALWEELANDDGLHVEQRAKVYRELSRAYLRRLEISAATDMLNLCLKLDMPENAKGDCLYELAETQMLTEDLEASENSLNALLLMKGISPERRVAAVFMLADVLEQQNRLDEAARHYESIRDTYPNRKVVEIRLNSLKGKKNTRRAPDVVPKR